MNTIRFVGGVSLSLLFVAGCASTEDDHELKSVEQKLEGWQECATEGGYCDFLGTRQVRYGTPWSYVTQTFTGGVPCSNQVFGDPAYGTVKTCWVEGGDGFLGDYGPYDDEGPSYRCYNQYSDVVAVYIDYAPWHCEGWTGKVFCEYESLSSQYGPGWGTCQCYNTVCEAVRYAKHGRTCRYRRCY